jgi:hypothetical protein
MKINENRSKILIFALLGAVLGVILLLWGSFGAAESNEEIPPSSSDEISAYCEYLEGQAKRLCESVAGVSGVTVAITLEGGFEQVYATDRTTTSNSQSLEHVKLGSGSSAALCAVSVSTPNVAGIGVTCRGGRDDRVRAELTALLSAAFGVKTNKIYITEAG